MKNKKVLLRENARGIPTAKYPVLGLSHCGRVGVPQSWPRRGGYPSPGWEGEYPWLALRFLPPTGTGVAPGQAWVPLVQKGPGTTEVPPPPAGTGVAPGQAGVPLIQKRPETSHGVPPSRKGHRTSGWKYYRMGYPPPR